MTVESCQARRHAGQPPTAPMGGGFAPTRGAGLPYVLCTERTGLPDLEVKP